MTSVNRPIEEMLDTECPKDIRRPRRNDSLATVVADYIDHRRDKARAERETFARPLTLSEAARLAGLAQTKGGKSFSHQRRVPKAALRRSARRLQAAVSALSACRDFDALHALIQGWAVCGGSVRCPCTTLRTVLGETSDSSRSGSICTPALWRTRRCLESVPTSRSPTCQPSRRKFGAYAPERSRTPCASSRIAFAISLPDDGAPQNDGSFLVPLRQGTLTRTE